MPAIRVCLTSKGITFPESHPRTQQDAIRSILLKSEKRLDEGMSPTNLQYHLEQVISKPLSNQTFFKLLDDMRKKGYLILR